MILGPLQYQRYSSSRQRTANDTKITHVDERFVLGVKSMKVWRCVDRYRGNYKVKRFSCWEQFLSMAFAQLTYRESLRDIETCLRAAGEKLYHMGIREGLLSP